MVKELKLADYGFEPADDPLPLVALSPTEAPITVGDTDLIGASTADTAAYRQFRAMLNTFKDALAPFWSKTMPAMSDRDMTSLMTFAQMGMKLRFMGRNDMLEFFRVATLPMRDLVDEHFESDALKAALCWDGMVGTTMAPRSPNQAVLTLLNRMAGSHAGQHVLPLGGMKHFIDTLERAANAAGVEIRTSSPVKRVVVDGSEQGLRARGIETADGEIVEATRVVSSADPKTTFLNLVGAPQLEIEFSNRIRRLRTKGYVAKLNLALGGEPRFKGLERADGRMILAGHMDDIEFAWDDAKYGGVPNEPVMEVTIPSLRRAGLAPAGQHVLSANVMYVPGALKGGWDDVKRNTLVEKLISQLETHAPRLRELVLHSELLTPADLEVQYHVSGGHWHHAEPAIDQLLMMRPTYEAAQYRTPIPGLFLCGAGSHPGGDITGNPGRNAAREILS